MFFWFTNNDTFSIIDALMKLILVITGSALIICFCHRLTNFKKTRRYKYDFTRVPFGPTAAAAAASTSTSSHPNISQFRPGEQDLSQVAALAYDPYNTIRNPLSQTFLNGGTSFQLPLAAGLASAYGYHNPEAAVAAYQSLAALNLDGQGSVRRNLEAVGGEALGGEQADQTQANTPNTAHIYSTSVRSDCSSFQAQQLGSVGQLPAAGTEAGEAEAGSGLAEQEESCPTYEEAIASQQQDGDQ